MSSEQKTDHPKTISAVKKKDEAHKKLKANTTRHFFDNKVVKLISTVFQDKICEIGEEQIMTFLENHDLSQLSVQSFFEMMCQIQESRATDQHFKVIV